MQRLFFVLLIWLFASWTNSNVYANAANMGQIAVNPAGKRCVAPQKPPSVIVHVQTREPMIDHSLPRSRLKEFNVATVSPYGDSKDVHVNGLMRGAISVGTQSAVAWQHSNNQNDNCFWFDQIEVTLRLNPTIYIAREIPYNSCLYKEVMAHEFQHFNTDFQVAKDYQAIFDRELNRMARELGVIGPYTRDMGMRPKEELLKRLDALVTQISAHMKEDRLLRQARIDTREEYDRIAQACPQDSKHYH